MAVTVKGTPTSAAAASVALPAHAVGDLIVIFAFRDGSTVLPTKPAASGTVPAWTDIDANTGTNTSSARTAYFVATATNHTSGTWTNATGIVAVVCQGHGTTNPIGAHAESGGAVASSAVAPAIDGASGGNFNLIQWFIDGTSLILEFFGHRNVTAWGAAPTGFTRQTSVATEVCCDTRNSSAKSAYTVAFGTTSQPCTTSASGGYHGATVEVVPAVLGLDAFSDDFSTKDTTKWVNWTANTIVSGNQLNISPAVSGSEFIQSAAPYGILGKAGFAQIVSVPAIGAGACAAQLGMQQDYTANMGGLIVIYWKNGSLFFSEYTNGVEDTPVTIAYNAANHKWWRIRESGGTIFWDTSADGITWTNRRNKVTANDYTRIYPFFEVDLDASGTTGGVFDNFNWLPQGAVIAAIKKLSAALTGTQSTPASSGTISVTAKKVAASFGGEQRYVGAIAVTTRKVTVNVVGYERPSGSISTSIKKLTASLSGTQQYIGSVATTLKPVTTSISGYRKIVGSIASTLQKPLFSGSGTQTQLGTVSTTLKKLTASLAGYERPAGSISATTRKVVFSGNGTLVYTGNIAANIKKLTANLVGVQRFIGNIAVTQKKPTASITAEQRYVGIIAATQKKLTASVIGEQRYIGNIAATIKKLTSSLVGVEYPQGTIVATIKKVQFSSAGAIASFVGAISASLKHPTSSLSGKEFARGSIAATTKQPTASLSGVQKYIGAIASNVQKTTFTGSGYRRPTGPIAVTIQKLTYAASGIAYPGGPLAVSLKKTQFSGSGEQRFFGAINSTTKKPLFAGSGSKTTAVGGTLGGSIKKLAVASSGAVFGPYRSGALLASKGFRLMKTASGRLIKLGG